MTTPAEELKAAAAKLRRDGKAAEMASPSPWRITEERVIRCGNGLIVADRSEAAYDPDEAADLPYIAAMGPVVGLALADWLDSSAQLHEPTVCGKHEGCALLGCQWCADEDWPCADMRHALAVARAINGGPS